MGIKILYHNNCFDGFGSAWAAYRKFGDEATYHPMNYDSFIPQLSEDDTVYMIDYCRKAPELVNIALLVEQLIIIDHHKSALPHIEMAQKELEAFGTPKEILMYFSTGNSGAVLAWQFFFKMQPMPKLLEYIEDRDLWRFRHDNSHEFHAFMCAQPFEFAHWDELAWSFQEGSLDWLSQGKALYGYHKVLVEQFCKQVNFVSICGYDDIPCVSVSMLFSEVPHRLLEMYPDAPFAMYEYHRAGIWQYGVRGRGDFDVTLIALAYGGGGHRDSAGFETFAPLSVRKAEERFYSVNPALGMGYQGIQPQYIEKRRDPYQVPAVEVLRRQEALKHQPYGFDPGTPGGDKAVLVKMKAGEVISVKEGVAGQALGISNETGEVQWVDPVHIGVDPARKSVTIHNQSDSQSVLVDPDFHWDKLPEQFHLVQPGEVFDTEDAST